MLSAADWPRGTALESKLFRHRSVNQAEEFIPVCGAAYPGLFIPRGEGAGADGTATRDCLKQKPVHLSEKGIEQEHQCRELYLRASKGWGEK